MRDLFLQTDGTSNVGFPRIRKNEIDESSSGCGGAHEQMLTLASRRTHTHMCICACVPDEAFALPCAHTPEERSSLSSPMCVRLTHCSMPEYQYIIYTLQERTAQSRVSILKITHTLTDTAQMPSTFVLSQCLCVCVCVLRATERAVRAARAENTGARGKAYGLLCCRRERSVCATY